MGSIPEILAKIFLMKRLGRDPREEFDSSTLKTLIEGGYIDADLNVRSDKRGEFTIGVIGGVFDIIHKGHIETLKEARSRVDALVVIVATDKTVEKMKGHPPVNTAEDRRYVVEAIKYVDYAVIGDENDFRKPLYAIDPDIIFLGYDQNIPPGITPEDLKGRLVVRLNVEVEGVKTSLIKKRIVEYYLDSDR